MSIIKTTTKRFFGDFMMSENKDHTERSKPVIWGYIRCDLDDPDGSIQADCLRRAQIPDENMFYESKTGFRQPLVVLNAMLDRLNPGDIVFAVSLSSFGREIGEIFNVFQSIREHGASVVCIEDELGIHCDSRDENGSFVFHALSLMNDLKISLNQKKIRNGFSIARLAGHGGPAKKVTDQQIIQAISRINNGETISSVVKSLGISRQAFNNRCKKISGLNYHKS